MADEPDRTAGGPAPADDNDGSRNLGRLASLLLVVIAALGMGAIVYLLLSGKAVEIKQRLESRACLSCHVDLKKKLKYQSVHLPFRLERCTACHSSHRQKSGSSHGAVDRPSKLVASDEKLCADLCHQRTYAEASRRKYSMPPFAKKKCMSCHEPHASKNDNLTVAPTKALCLSCHPKIAKYYLKPKLHPPFAIGSCTSCHKPHASDTRPLLRRQPRVLCLACHQPIAQLTKLPIQMEPFTQGRCPECHNPHGADQEKLLRAPMPDLCFQCHKGIARLKSRPFQMRPFREGKCLECHRPHASAYRRLLIARLEGNELCFTCHSSYRRNYNGIGHSRVISNASHYQPEAGVGSCLNCHEPHGADFPGLIQKEQISLCFGCHGPRRYFAHPLGINYDDPWRGGYLRCGSCHNPMGSGITRLKRRDRDGLCLSCHDRYDPAVIQYSDRPWHRYRIPDSM